jgi:hypothetical protein
MAIFYVDCYHELVQPITFIIDSRRSVVERVRSQDAFKEITDVHPAQ